MYVRPQSYKYPSGMRLPENYSGNTFREQPPEEVQEEETAEAVKEEAEEATQTAALLTQKDGFGLRLSSLFGGKGIGSEELLILALILLLADSDGCEDLVLFLVLLFFIK
jgi:hypothetical protein